MPRGRPKPSQIMLGNLSEVPQAPGTLPWGLEEQTAIAQTVAEFARCWARGDAAGMTRCLHPDLVKRMVHVGMPSPPKEAMAHVQGVQAALGPSLDSPRLLDIRVLDVCGRSASARACIGPWLAYLHLSRFGRAWTLVNVLWEWLDE